MHSATGTRRDTVKRKSVGDVIKNRELETIQASHVAIPNPQLLTHLQFRRFAGCPMCNLHIHSFVERSAELVAHGIQEIAIFHSSKKKMIKRHATAPFAIIADRAKSLYREFGVEASVISIIHPQSWVPVVRGIFRHGVSLPEFGENPLGLPADFLIGKDGKIQALNYGSHAYDQWSVDELLELVNHAEKDKP
jgi:peroxiredoxin